VAGCEEETGLEDHTLHVTGGGGGGFGDQVIPIGGGFRNDALVAEEQHTLQVDGQANNSIFVSHRIGGSIVKRIHQARGHHGGEVLDEHGIIGCGTPVSITNDHGWAGTGCNSGLEFVAQVISRDEQLFELNAGVFLFEGDDDGI